MRRDGSWFSQAAETPLAYALLIAYVLLIYPGHRPGGEGSLHEWAVRTLGAKGLDIQDGEPWRVLTHAVVHGNFVHLAFNGLALLWLGPGLEKALGSARFGLLYCVTAMAGGIAGVWWHGPLDPLVGGSGALFGMMGAIVALNMRAGRHLLDFLDHAGSRTLLSLIALNLVLGWVIPQVSNAAHLGGLIAGFVLTFMFLERGRSLSDGLTRAAQAGWIALFASTTLYTCVPTARVDYLVRRLVQAETRAERLPYATALAETDVQAEGVWLRDPNTPDLWLRYAAEVDAGFEPGPDDPFADHLPRWRER